MPWQHTFRFEPHRDVIPLGPRPGEAGEQTQRKDEVKGKRGLENADESFRFLDLPEQKGSESRRGLLCF